LNLGDGESRGNAVGAAVLLVELADGLGRAVAGKLSRHLCVKTTVKMSSGCIVDDEECRYTYDPLSGSAADLPAIVVRKARVGSGLAAVGRRRRRRVRAGSGQGGESGEGNGCELHCERFLSV
jgi:hypothetical protein